MLKGDAQDWGVLANASRSLHPLQECSGFDKQERENVGERFICALGQVHACLEEFQHAERDVIDILKHLGFASVSDSMSKLSGGWRMKAGVVGGKCSSRERSARWSLGRWSWPRRFG